MLTFFKPNKSGTGSVIDFSLNSTSQENNKPGVFVKITLQCGGMDAPFRGATDFTAIKFGVIEIGALINVFERKTNWSTVHKGDNFNRSISVSILYKKGENQNPTKEISGVGFSTTVNNKKYGFVLKLEEMVVVREFFKYSLEHIFNGLRSAEKKKFQNLSKKKEIESGESSDNTEIDL